MIGCRLQVGAGGRGAVCRAAQEHAAEPPGEPGDTGAGPRPRHPRHSLPEGMCLRKRLHQQEHMKLCLFVYSCGISQL